jgi:hypothetical protein
MPAYSEERKAAVLGKLVTPQNKPAPEITKNHLTSIRYYS